MKSELYLDYAATTPLDPRVHAVMTECMRMPGGVANPSSAHRLGRAAAEEIAVAADTVGALINADPNDLIWTSGATESNNLAILGSALALQTRAPERRRILVLATDHSAAIEPVRAAAKLGFTPVILPISPSGALTPAALASALDSDVALVSMALVNNETGVMQDIAALAPLVKAAGARLHVDAAQAAGRLSIDVAAHEIDFLSFSAHKFYGPKGIGALYSRAGVALEPLLHGGGQQRGKRSGTLPLPLIKGMAAAFSLPDDAAEQARQSALRQRLIDGLASSGPVIVNGEGLLAPHVVSVSFPGVHGAALAHALDGMAISHGSACGSQHGPSHVLRAMGVSNVLAQATVRASIGRFSTESDINQAIEKMGDAVSSLRDISPVSKRQPRAKWLERQGFLGAPLGQDGYRRGSAGSEDLGCRIDCWLKSDAGILSEVRFEVFAEHPTIETAAWLAEWLQGRQEDEACSVNGLWLAEQTVLPAERRGDALCIEDALRAALGDKA